MNYFNQEVDKFAKLSKEWWDPNGELHTLHEINPIRLAWIDQQAAISGKKVLDLGCGGGLLTESMAKVGAITSGIDLAAPLIETARQHQQQSGLEIDYHCISVEEFSEQRQGEFSVVTCMEMLEHVPDPYAIIAAANKLIGDSGKIILSTLNRTIKSYLFAIIAAEYLLRLMPVGTHHYPQFIRPSEIDRWAQQLNLKVEAITGVHYNPVSKQCHLTDTVNVNYMLCLSRLKQS